MFRPKGLICCTYLPLEIAAQFLCLIPSPEFGIVVTRDSVGLINYASFQSVVILMNIARKKLRRGICHIGGVIVRSL